MRATTAIILACLAVYALGVDPYVSGFTPDRPATAFTSMFLHASALHLALNMLALAVFGTLAERELGSLLFLAVFVVAGLAGAACHALVASTILVGASGAILGVMAVCAVLRPATMPFVATFAAINVAQLVLGAGGDVSVGSHVGGFAAGFVIVARRA